MHNMEVLQGVNALFRFPLILGIPRCSENLGFPTFPNSIHAMDSNILGIHEIPESSAIRSISAKHAGITGC